MRATRRHVLIGLGATALALPLSRTRKLAPGSLAIVTFGPSAGKVVRLEKTLYPPPGSEACAVRTLQPHGPIWVVDKWLEWDVTGYRGVMRRYRYMIAPWTALEAIPERGNVIDCRRLSRWTSRRGC